MCEYGTMFIECNENEFRISKSILWLHLVNVIYYRKINHVPIWTLKNKSSNFHSHTCLSEIHTKNIIVKINTIPLPYLN